MQNVKNHSEKKATQKEEGMPVGIMKENNSFFPNFHLKRSFLY